MLTLLVTMGYGLVENTISLFSLKLIMFFTVTKFFVSYLASSLYSMEFLVPTIITVEVLYTFILMLVIMMYMVHNLKTLSISQQLAAQDDRLNHLANALKYRTNLIVATYTLIMVQYLCEVGVTIFSVFILDKQKKSDHNI